MILLDSSIWSLFLRRKQRDLNPHERAIVHHVHDLIVAGDAVIIPLICHEVLSGISDKAKFDYIKARLLAIDELPLQIETYTLAAEFFNTCRAKGTAPGAIDMTICAAAHLHHTPIFTTDPDFPLYARHLPFSLYNI
jgi:predicted nucleic acid-binding protein